MSESKRAAAEAAAGRVEDLAHFCGNYLSGFPNSSQFTEWSAWLSAFSIRIREGLSASKEDVLELRALARDMCSFHIQPTAERLWRFFRAYEEAWSRVTKPGYPAELITRGRVSELYERIRHADEIGLDIQSQLSRDQPSGLAALLLLHVMRTETIHYAIHRDLSDTISRFRLSEKYDADEICSITMPLRRGEKQQPDVRVIRDAIAHSWFRFEERDEWVVVIDARREGWELHDELNLEDIEALLFAHRATYLTQIMLLYLIEAMAIAAHDLAEVTQDDRVA